MVKLTRKNVPFSWGEEQVLSFNALKSALCSAPILKIFDPKNETRVICDASDSCIGAVLEQKIDNFWHPVEYLSKRLS